ncbi:hypothetical protein NQ318_021453 [Aromia moschata]|uniref:Uncharacterized protein n=1 Tax=Aromia moschata TaxID=1265417 RepID=A0AAV8ZD15_9CUCU|nr:hypothetical protein NQ318_021453 [Aromia moschata]
MNVLFYLSRNAKGSQPFLKLNLLESDKEKDVVIKKYRKLQYVFIKRQPDLILGAFNRVGVGLTLSLLLRSSKHPVTYGVGPMRPYGNMSMSSQIPLAATAL